MPEDREAGRRRLTHAELEELLDVLLDGSWSRLGGDRLDWADLDDH
jgi:hypothetical protein